MSLLKRFKESTKDLELANKNLQERQEEVLQQSEELKATLHQLSTAQNKLIQSEKMASLGILAAGVAHEINNPLNYIMGAQSGLADYFKEHGSGDGEKTDFFQNSILSGVERISGIINGLDQFSRNNDQLDEECNIHSILDNCLIMLNNKLENKADIEKDYCADPILIKGNVGKLHHVFINILDNSVHAIVEKGKIKIHTSTSAKYVLIIIEDNGIGIDEKYLSKITDPFFTTNAPGEGTGLGLAITYSIIKDHMGSLEYQSEVNKGTRAIIKLPIG
jgi:signal transduction histidine kinase